MRRESLAVSSIALALVAVTQLTCGDDRSDRTSEASSDAPARRVISLIPAATEIILSLGAGDRLIARTDFDEQPSLSNLPSVGQGLSPSLEALAELRPDLVVSWPDNVARTLNARLSELGVTVYAPEIQSLSDIYAAIERLGVLLGARTAADSLAGSIASQLTAVREAVAGLDRPRVLYVVWHDPPQTAAAGTFIHELIEIAGGRNIFGDVAGLWPQVSIEECVRRDPDLVLLPRASDSPLTSDRLRSTTGWRQIPAVREGRILTLEANLFNRPGPHVGTAARRLARRLHPDVEQLEPL